MDRAKAIDAIVEIRERSAYCDRRIAAREIIDAVHKFCPSPDKLNRLEAALRRARKFTNTGRAGVRLWDNGNCSLIHCRDDSCGGIFGGYGSVDMLLPAIEKWCDEHERTSEQKQVEQLRAIRRWLAEVGYIAGIDRDLALELAGRLEQLAETGGEKMSGEQREKIAALKAENSRLDKVKRNQ